MARRAARLVSRKEYDVLIYAPDRLTALPASLDRRTINGLAKRGLIRFDAGVHGFDADRWAITDFGLLMISECIQVWKLQGELGI